MSEQTVRIYSYKKVWKLEKKIYSLQNIKLPFPVNPYEAMEFGGAIVVITLLGYFIPSIENIPVVIRLLAIPYAIMQFLSKKKLDGKNPLKYFIGYIMYFFTTKSRYLQLFKIYPAKRNKIALNWNCSIGIRQKEN